MVLDLRSGAQIIKDIGGQLVNELRERNPAVGGRVVMITGEQGAGKTSLMGAMVKRFRKEEYVIWRGRNLAQWHKFPNWEKTVQILVHKNDEVEFIKIPLDGREGKVVDIPVVKYTDARDAFRKLRKDKINVIYEPSSYTISPELLEDVREKTGRVIPPQKLNEDKPAYFWFEFLYILLTRNNRDWYSVFIDEADDVFPETVPGAQFILQEWVKDILKDLRKALVSLILSVHTVTNIDWRIRTKIPVYIYLRGARVRRGSNVKQKFVMLLSNGSAVIEKGRYGIFSFDYLSSPGYDIQVTRKRREGGML